MNTTLSLKLPPEVAKIMPWIIAAKKTGDLKQAEWAKQEYERAQQIALWREQREREDEERRLEHERRLREEDERAERFHQAWLAQEALWAVLGVHYALEEGDWLELIQPNHSSQKGWRRLLSECPDLIERSRYGKWGGRHQLDRSNQNPSRHNNFRGNKYNCGRKPRKPWFRKRRRNHI